ncbi:MAG: response regulator [Candidatus Magasanikbacteria bacterium CG_4_9_14_3_um_filter_32_9]|uniref:Response regulator n=1 Tax=Candidatus Magasanikbacteria bacterium CG_4_9_14_3_um_filter_32_9 TaxID=1974644 RepID=A0A2M7Z671_9BACT|nr:MAG: response regulator [Candidatus Magasanikbacteria bacterium CG_4_9_14_3_um_filter_32_9]
MENVKKILIVEDDEPIIFSLSKKLELFKTVKVLCARNGEEGLSMALVEKPDLILLDIVMPEMDGIEMLRRLRKNDWGKTVKVIILSNLSSPEREDEAKKLGIKDYIIKAEWKLENVVSKVLEKLTE